LRISFDAEVNHFNSAVKVMGKQGLDYLVQSKAINNTTVLATRDGLVSVAKFVGVDLGKVLKFKPWGATNLAKNLNGALAVFGLAMEAWDTWEQAKRQDAFVKARSKIVEQFESQRQDLLGLINGEDFETRFFTSYVDLENDVTALNRQVLEQREQRSRFHAWRQAGQSIDVEFREVNA
jgi:hypothetical protein